MRLERHPLVAQDIEAILAHVLQGTGGDVAAAERRADEIAGLLEAIRSNPLSGARQGGALGGCLARHGGRGRMITILFEPHPERGVVRILVAFGGQDWMRLSRGRIPDP
ncbi:hypothetical protein BH23PSE1_BH23PSE1_09840 [soil metagenome]